MFLSFWKKFFILLFFQWQSKNIGLCISLYSTYGLNIFEKENMNLSSVVWQFSPYQCNPILIHTYLDVLIINLGTTKLYIIHNFEFWILNGFYSDTFSQIPEYCGIGSKSKGHSILSLQKSSNHSLLLFSLPLAWRWFIKCQDFS